MLRPRLALTLFAMLVLPSMAPSQGHPKLSYRFELVQTPVRTVRVHMGLPGADDGMTILEVVRDWGGVNAGGEDISNVVATDVSGKTLEVIRPRPDSVVVRHAPGAAIMVSYAFTSNDHQAQRERSTFRRPILNDHLFRTVGHLGLLSPRHIDQQTTCTVQLSWDGFDAAGWHVVSSWGVGSQARTITASPRDLSEALYLAGDFSLLTRDIRGYPLTITVSGDQWGFTHDEFADLCARIVDEERAFFDDFERDFYWVSLVGTGQPMDQGFSIGGTGLKNCFSLSATPNTTLTNEDGTTGELVRTLAHEMFHEWNGVNMRREEPEQLMYWFSEGFTDFYARRVMYRGGFIDRDAYAASASRTLKLYATSPMRDEPNARVLSEFWNDRHVQKLPYYRGDIVAMILDASIRQHSGGKSSLDDAMRELLRISRTGTLLNMENVFATFAKYANAATIASLRDVVENGGRFDIPRDLFAPCLAVEAVDVYQFDVGFDLQTSMREKKVVGLREGTAAVAAGLHEGMTLKGWSVHGDNVNKEAVFQVLIDSVVTDIRYYPRGAPVPCVRVTPVEGEPDCTSL